MVGPSFLSLWRRLRWRRLERRLAISTGDDTVANFQRFIDARFWVSRHVARHAQIRFFAGRRLHGRLLIFGRLRWADERSAAAFHGRQIALEVLLFQDAVAQRDTGAAHQNIGFYALRLDRATARRVVAQRRQTQARAAWQIDDGLHRALAEGGRPDEGRTLVVLQRPGHELARPGAV